MLTRNVAFVEARAHHADTAQRDTYQLTNTALNPSSAAEQRQTTQDHHSQALDKKRSHASKSQNTQRLRQPPNISSLSHIHTKLNLR